MGEGLPSSRDTGSLASRFGSDLVTLTHSNLPAHVHQISDPGHSHVASMSGSRFELNTGLAGSADSIQFTGISGTSRYGDPAIAETGPTGISIQSAGSGNGFCAHPPTVNIVYVIGIL